MSNGDSNDVQQKFSEFHSQGEAYVRENPSQAVLSALAAGFVLRLLPLGAIIGALVRVALFALRPASFHLRRGGALQAFQRVVLAAAVSTAGSIFQAR